MLWRCVTRRAACGMRRAYSQECEERFPEVERAKILEVVEALPMLPEPDAEEGEGEEEDVAAGDDGDFGDGEAGGAGEIGDEEAVEAEGGGDGEEGDVEAMEQQTFDAPEEYAGEYEGEEGNGEEGTTAESFVDEKDKVESDGEKED
jgi:hypothetical protein